jgi:hypothetical protein
MIRRNEPKGGEVKLVQVGYILVKRRVERKEQSGAGGGIEVQSIKWLSKWLRPVMSSLAVQRGRLRIK